MRYSTRSRLGSAAGVSLIELLIAMLVTAVIAAMAVVQVGAARPGMLGDGAMRGLMTQLSVARETAVAQRRSIELRFVGDGELQIHRQNLPSGTEMLRTFTMEGGVRFHLSTPAVDTPDGFGATSAISFGTARKVIFNSDGMLVDEAGNPLNGSLFVALADYPSSARAVTILGSTGRIRGFRWTGGQWTQV